MIFLDGSSRMNFSMFEQYMNFPCFMSANKHENVCKQLKRSYSASCSSVSASSGTITQIYINVF